MSTESNLKDPHIKPHRISSRHVNRLKILGLILTLIGISLFCYFVYAVGPREILDNVEKFGFAGFAVILFISFLRICSRAAAWKLSVYEPYSLGLKDTIPAVIIGEAMSSMIPLGILVSGTSKAVAVRNRLPLVVGLSSVATENLFYSFVTSIFLILGSFTFLRNFHLDTGWVWTIDILIAAIFGVLIFLTLMIIRQWHFASEICERLYAKGLLKGILETGRLQVRLFENLIYGYYRRYPRRFMPIAIFQAAFHLLGILEVWIILSRITGALPDVTTAFLLESVSRLITIVFKLVPFVIGVDEAGARFVAETLSIGAGIGVTLAIIRKGRILFWTAVGLILIIKRGLSLREIKEAGSSRTANG
ncbi:MAG: lysylphosphatidylglycerol synthase domain-containing protein [Pyrinomonadaceae bacterium]